MQFTQRQQLLSGRWKPLLAAIPLGLLLGFAGPFGTYPAFPTATRYAFWIGLTAAGAVAALAVDALVSPTRLRAGPLRIGAIALLSALPMTFVVAWIMSVIQPGRTYSPQQLLALFWGVAAVQLLIAFATTFLATAAGQVEDGPVAPVLRQEGAAAFPAAFLKRLPRPIGDDIIALETEDHYLRVHAAGGSALILMRMSDAIAIIPPALGTQVHRRWWVAEAAVAGIRTEGQKLSLSLSNGNEVPVGRTFSATVRTRFARLNGAAPPGLA